MMPSNTYGFKNAVKNHSNLTLDPENIIPGGDLFGLSEFGKFFSDYDDEGFINIYFDSENYGERIKAFSKKLSEEIERLKKCIKDKKEVKVKKEFENILSVDKDNNIVYNRDEYKNSIAEKGFFARQPVLLFKREKVYN